jgi:hypothetical protein
VTAGRRSRPGVAAIKRTGSTELLCAIQNHYLKVDRPDEAIAVWKQAIVLSDNGVLSATAWGSCTIACSCWTPPSTSSDDRGHGQELPGSPFYRAHTGEPRRPEGGLTKNKAVLGEVGG